MTHLPNVIWVITDRSGDNWRARGVVNPRMDDLEKKTKKRWGGVTPGSLIYDMRAIKEITLRQMLEP